MQAAAAFGKRKSTMLPFTPALDAADCPAEIAEIAQNRENVAGDQDYASHRGIPYLTCSIIAVLALVFWVECVFVVEPSEGSDPSPQSLLALGALNTSLVFDGWQWWRLFTAPLLHGGISHILGNAVALLFAGWILERQIGPRWFAALFLVSGVGGSIGSLVWNPEGAVSVGASGAITGLLASAFVCSYIFTSAQLRQRMQKVSIRLLVPSLLPAALPVAMSGNVDYGAHFGGAVAGALVGLILYETWPETAPRPLGKALASAIVVIGVVFSLGGFALNALFYPLFASLPVAHTLIPEREGVEFSDDDLARSAELVERFPRDPRVRLLRGLFFLKHRSLADAERHIRIGLGEADLLKDMPVSVEQSLKMSLALILVAERRNSEARLVARTVCGITPEREVTKLYDNLRRSGACG